MTALLLKNAFDAEKDTVHESDGYRQDLNGNVHNVNSR
jgi:hypothetical protein